MRSYECKLFIGSRRDGYDGEPFTKKEVIHEIKLCQDAYCISAGCVRITETTYVYLNYEEDGFEISIMQYPRFPKTESMLWAFMHNLAEHLMVVFNQNRISVMDPEHVEMLEVPNAQENPGEHSID